MRLKVLRTSLLLPDREFAREDFGGGSRHDDRSAVTPPADFEFATAQLDADLVVHGPSEHGHYGHRAGTASAGEGFADSAFPGSLANSVASERRDELDVGSVRERGVWFSISGAQAPHVCAV